MTTFMTLLYAIICSAIVLRVVTFDRQGGEHRLLPALLAWLIVVAAGAVPLRLLLGILSPPGLSAIILAALVLAVLIGSRGSVCRLLPRRHHNPTASQLNERFLP